MFRDDHPSEAPAIADDGSITLHVPPCVQQFSTRRRLLSRLRALARRRIQGLRETEAGPLKLQVEQNPNWLPAAEPPMGAIAEAGAVGVADEAILGDEAETSERETGPDGPSAVSAPWTHLEIPLREAEAPEEASERVIQRLTEDNRDLKAALCRLIRISEQNHEALRLLEEENEELSVLVDRLTTGPARASAAAGAASAATIADAPRWLPAWGVERFRRWQAR
jgi:hypothetical protein